MDELCQGRIGCRMTAVWDASDNAHRIEVVQIQMPNTDGFGACTPFEFWMVSGHKPKTKPALLAAFCNDGYGASGSVPITLRLPQIRFYIANLGARLGGGAMA